MRRPARPSRRERARRVPVPEWDRILRRPASAGDVADELEWAAARGDVLAQIIASWGGELLAEVLLTPREATARAADLRRAGDDLIAAGVPEDDTDWSPRRRAARAAAAGH